MIENEKSDCFVGGFQTRHVAFHKKNRYRIVPYFFNNQIRNAIGFLLHPL